MIVVCSCCRTDYAGYLCGKTLTKQHVDQKTTSYYLIYCRLVGLSIFTGNVKPSGIIMLNVTLYFWKPNSLAKTTTWMKSPSFTHLGSLLSLERPNKLIYSLETKENERAHFAFHFHSLAKCIALSG